ncbi:nitrite reductase large subunit NirB [Tuwongella immobilis]|uniref:Rieske domain-containing protein n=1 Tax=Tuwongella immobilis TaxID=692036 RepID=A0A6C2YHH3_9BACT|nr:nitrite reductase large subunit NirB [Tuwongella immobilis]VIP00980.1 nitrite reductase : Nitrite reductase (NAD(P)H), large subunit OS=Chthoniobacter flavus Ellin428 GN=CfE428DRAFT_5852 PE=4 SV=1: Pyr_redox_2: Pyr_redox: Fer2_BFD: NIR_SIR_ferr: NIR_SIR [Tuwongella immobilis]VTR97378.1 nitrite reductase : Nitrite reductase (NAD(P)H), large subunit OS=Chthoniobacter flavus Ellin428 GN=CfE428DRAFT_5852 PE=4 SV=1: Pyr_redox_2: Pyr_redox: Fer2_BFD: NIR_SIR_ferr: NIR_SIR [Tuwongella immobilis]
MIAPAIPQKPKLVVIGNGMAGARLLEDILAADPDRFDITVFGDEPYGNYNRILLSNVLNGSQEPTEIFLNPLAWYAENGITLHAGKRVTAVDRAARTVTADDLTVPYDVLVFATGSKPFVPPIPGTTLHGVFVFRTLDDCRNIAEYALDAKKAVVIGGGLLGLEAAKGLMTHQVEVTVVEMAPWLMSVQLDESGGQVLQQTIEKMGILARTKTSTQAILGHRRVTGVRFADGSEIDADMVVISAGIRPNIDLAREIGLECDRALVVDDHLQTSDPAIFGVGECVQHRGMVYGLVAPIWEQTKVLAQRLTGTHPDAAYVGSKIATKLKVMGVELASMGRMADLQPTDEVVQFSEPGRQVYWKAIIRDGKVNAACLLGDLGPADHLVRLFQSGRPAPERRLELFFTAGSNERETSLADLPESHPVCDCNGVTKGTICDAIRAGKCTIPAVGKATRAGTGCGSCKKLIKGLIEAVAGGIKADPSESWYVPAVPMDKATLVAAVKERGLRSVSAVLREWGTGDDEKSKAGLASMLKGIWGSEYIDERDARFVNDRVHANIQKDGTFSVVPRAYGGVTTADDLIRIGEVAKKYNVPMLKYTGGQRIDLLGIKKEDLPHVWRDLGMPSGHAYTKALRTVKTCVGSEFCRFGTNDSTSLGIALEKRYQGFEFPAKVKLGVSGCPRNCAESTVKDVGIIATEGGDWEISIGGAAGAHVRKTDVLCRVKTQAEAIRIIGRFLIYYRDNAKWLERTYDFVPRIGLERVREIIVEDVLGIGEQLDAEVEKTAAAYVDPWLERDAPVYPGQFDQPRLISLPVLS